MRVTPTPRIEPTIQHFIESGQYPDAEAVIDQALQALAAQEHARWLKLRELVRAGHQSGIAGELTAD